MCYIIINDNADGFDAYIVVKVPKGEENKYLSTYRTKKEALASAVVANEAKSAQYSTTMESHLNKTKMDEERVENNKNTKRRYRL